MDSDETFYELTSLQEAVHTLRVFCGMVILDSIKMSKETTDEIIRNFIARGLACTESILLVWESGAEQDAWILFRTLLDRLFHLHDLIEKDNFADFEEFSFCTKYEGRHKLLSETNQEIRNKVPDIAREIHESQRLRYVQLKTKGINWHRPKPKDVAKKMKLDFLYKYGYDFASARNIHPLSDDGEQDLIRITTPRQPPKLENVVVKNSILAQCLLIQVGFNAGGLQWRAIAHNFVDELSKFVGDTSNLSFHQTCLKIAENWPDFTLCEPRIKNK